MRFFANRHTRQGGLEKGIGAASRQQIVGIGPRYSRLPKLNLRTCASNIAVAPGRKQSLLIAPRSPSLPVNLSASSDRAAVERPRSCTALTVCRRPQVGEFCLTESR